MSGGMASSFLMAPGGSLTGRLRVPGDKSISHRAIMLGGHRRGRDPHQRLPGGRGCARHPGGLPRAWGCEIEGPEAGRVRVHGVGLRGLKAPDGPLDMGNSGTSMRLLAGLLAGQSFPVTLIGDASLSRRPMRRVTEPLALMGARIDDQRRRHGAAAHPAGAAADGYRLSRCRWPAPRSNRACCWPGSMPQGETCVTEPAPTRDHTERMLTGFGYPVRRQGARVCLTGGGRLTRLPAAGPGGHLLGRLFPGGGQHRAGFRSDCWRMSASIRPGSASSISCAPWAPISSCSTGAPRAASRWRICGCAAAPLKGIRIPVDQVPLAIDEFPGHLHRRRLRRGRDLLTGAEELRVKESDRIQVMADGLTPLGIAAEPLPDGIRIVGGTARPRRRRSTPMAITGSPWPLPWPACAPRAPSRFATAPMCETSFPGLPPGRRRAVGGMRDREDFDAAWLQPRCRSPVPVITIDGPSGTGKGTIAALLADAPGLALPGQWRALSGAGAGGRTRAGIDLDDGRGPGALAGGAAADLSRRVGSCWMART